MGSPRLNRAALFHDLGYVPHPGQWNVHKSSAKRRILACGVRWGKTLCAAMEGLAAARGPKDGVIAWGVAPTYDLADRVFRELLLVVYRSLRHRVVQMREHDRRLVLRNMAGGLSEIRAKSADNPVSLLGDGLDWLIADDAARLKPAIGEGYLTQRLVDKKGWALLISTPKGKGYFYELFRRGQDGRDPDFESWNLPSWSNPHLDRDVIEAERDRLPERVFFQEYAGQFVEGAGAVFRYVREAATGEWQEPQDGQVYFGGLDLPKVPVFTVLVIVNKGGEVVAVDRFHRLDWSIQVARIVALCERYRVQRVKVGSTGCGEPVYEALRSAGCPASAYPFTQKSKAALVDNLALMLEKRSLVLPRADLCPEMVD